MEKTKKLYAILLAVLATYPVISQNCTNRQFVVETLSAHYGTDTALIMERRMHEMMQYRGLTSISMLATMWIECRFDHTQVNRFTGAYGIIQFMPKTCVTLSISYTTLLKFNVIQQLQLSEAYFSYVEQTFGCISTTEDLYVSILGPKYLDRAAGNIMYAYDTKAYNLNGCLDYIKGDGGITRDDLRHYIYDVVPFGAKIRLIDWVNSPSKDYPKINLGVNPCTSFNPPKNYAKTDNTKTVLFVYE